MVKICMFLSLSSPICNISSFKKQSPPSPVFLKTRFFNLLPVSSPIWHYHIHDNKCNWNLKVAIFFSYLFTNLISWLLLANFSSFYKHTLGPLWGLRTPVCAPLEPDSSWRIPLMIWRQHTLTCRAALPTYSIGMRLLHTHSRTHTVAHNTLMGTCGQQTQPR